MTFPEHLVLSSLLLTIPRVGANLLVVALEGREVLAGLGELTLDESASKYKPMAERDRVTYLLHTLTDVPVNEGTLGVQKVELVVCSATSVCLV